MKQINNLKQMKKEELEKRKKELEYQLSQSYGRYKETRKVAPGQRTNIRHEIARINTLLKEKENEA